MANALLMQQARELARTGEGRRIRIAGDLSLREVASEIGVHLTTLARWETGEMRPHGEAATRWAQLMVILEDAQRRSRRGVMAPNDRERVTIYLPIITSRRLMKWADHLHQSRAALVTRALDQLFATLEEETNEKGDTTT